MITISKSNTKVGNILSFSIPPVETCPGRTEWCERKCYAKRFKRYKNVTISYNNNLEATKSPTFVTDMVAKLTKATKKCKVVRIHVAGDFYSVDYIKAWISIVVALPEITFYTYTRSWRVEELAPWIEVLHALPNVTLFASTDVDTVRETVPDGFRQAFAGDAKSGLVKMVECPAVRMTETTCDKCSLCIRRNITTNVFFPTH